MFQKFECLYFIPCTYILFDVLYCIIFFYTVSYWNLQYETYSEKWEESSKEENVFRWPPKNIFKRDKSYELPPLVDAHGRGHKVAIIKPRKRTLGTTEPDPEIFESEEGDFSD